MVIRLVYEQHLKLVSQDQTTTKQIDIFKFEKKSSYFFFTCKKKLNNAQKAKTWIGKESMSNINLKRVGLCNKHRPKEI